MYQNHQKGMKSKLMFSICPRVSIRFNIREPLHYSVHYLPLHTASISLLLHVDRLLFLNSTLLGYPFLPYRVEKVLTSLGAPKPPAAFCLLLPLTSSLTEGVLNKKARVNDNEQKKREEELGERKRLERERRLPCSSLATSD